MKIEEEEEKKKAEVVVRARRRMRNGEKINRRARRRIQAEVSSVQRLFAISSAVFKGPGTVPTPGDVKMLQGFLDEMKPQDFGLSADLDFLKFRSLVDGTPTITYTSMYNCVNFSFCIIYLPPTEVIPLHNHPGMTVFSKLLIGKMHIKSYDWVDHPASEEVTPSNLKLARLVVDSEFTAPCNTCTLYPTAGGNIHTFKAITPCLVLDVLGPPYSMKEDRDCTYYRDHPYSLSDGSAGVDGEAGGKGLGWLEEIEMPKDLKMVGVEYRGPKIIDM